MVVAQEGAESRAANYRASYSVVVREPSPLFDELTVDALVEALSQIVLHEFRDHMAQMTLPEEDELIQALVPDRLHEPLRVWVAVGTLRRRLHAGNAARSQDRRIATNAP